MDVFIHILRLTTLILTFWNTKRTRICHFVSLFSISASFLIRTSGKEYHSQAGSTNVLQVDRIFSEGEAHNWMVKRVNLLGDPAPPKSGQSSFCVLFLPFCLCFLSPWWLMTIDLSMSWLFDFLCLRDMFSFDKEPLSGLLKGTLKMQRWYIEAFHKES